MLQSGRPTMGLYGKQPHTLLTAMKQDDFLGEFREIILLENYNQARDAVLVWLEKRVKQKAKLEQQLAAACEKGMTNSEHDKEVSRLQWQLTSETHTIMTLLAMIEASETALTVFREKMLDTLEMDVQKLEEMRRIQTHSQFYREQWLNSLHETIVATEQRNELLYKINGI